MQNKELKFQLDQLEFFAYIKVRGNDDIAKRQIGKLNCGKTQI